MSGVLDTNIIIYHLNDALGPSAEARIREHLEESSWISVVTRIEILGWPKHSIDSLRRAEDLLGLLLEQPLTDDIVGQCIALRQERRIKLPDAIIASTALQLSFPLVTRNTDDFGGINGLDLINPLE